MGHTAFWLLTALCALLLGSLCWALQRLYALELRTPKPADRPGEPRSENDRTSRETQALEELLRIVPSLQEYGISQADTADRETFCKTVLGQAVRAARAQRGWIWTWNQQRETLEPACSFEPADAEPEHKSLAERAFKNMEPLSDAARPGLVRTAWPLMAKSKPLGVLGLELDAPPDDADRTLLLLLASEAAAVLNQLQRFDNLQQFHIEMVETLYRTVNARDAQASDHAERTRQRAHRLALDLGLPEAMARHVEYAALLRGVGKIGIDQTLLNKPGKLTAEEYEKIKKYTTIGAEILARVTLLAPAAKMVLHHQEWYDGRGYPEGLKGNQIPLGARIIAVISAWEAMTSHRPYRKALTTPEALAELQRAAGTQFDPTVVDAFRKMEERKIPAQP